MEIGGAKWLAWAREKGFPTSIQAMGLELYNATPEAYDDFVILARDAERRVVAKEMSDGKAH